MLTIQTVEGPRKVRVCDYCACACIPSGRFCSGRCARAWEDKMRQRAAAKEKR